MKLKNKETGELYSIISGFILSEENYKAVNVNGSFLTIQKDGTEEKHLYMWKYYADNDFEIIEEEQEILQKAAESIVVKPTIESTIKTDFVKLTEETATEEDEVH